jgi:hypothetical protein
MIALVAAECVARLRTLLRVYSCFLSAFVSPVRFFRGSAEASAATGRTEWRAPGAQRRRRRRERLAAGRQLHGEGSKIKFNCMLSKKKLHGIRRPNNSCPVTETKAYKIDWPITIDSARLFLQPPAAN